MDPGSLSRIGRDIEQHFTEIAVIDPNASRPDTIFQQLRSEDFEAERQRFQLWAANLGLNQSGDRSLDYRLQDAPSVKEFTLDLLRELRDDLSQIGDLVAGRSRSLQSRGELNQSDQDESSDEESQVDEVSIHSEVQSHKPGNSILRRGEEYNLCLPSEDPPQPEDQKLSEVHILLNDVIDIIDRLYKLAAKVRSPTTRTAPFARNFYRHKYEDKDGNEFVFTREEREFAREQNESYQKRRIEEIARQMRRDHAGTPSPSQLRVDKFDAHTDAFIERMGMANAHRQQQFAFWREREWDRRSGSLRAGHVPQIDMHPTTKEDADGLLTITPSKKVRKEPALTKENVSEIPSWKLPRDFELQMNESKSTRTTVTQTPTVYEPSGKKIAWPPFPKELAGKKEFICPYCFVTCPPEYRGKSHWRAHLIQDLQPYVCTYPDCVEGDTKLLNNWEDWLVHERVNHRVIYGCADHVSLSFRDKSAYAEHVLEQHMSDREWLLKPAEIEKCVRPMPEPGRPCLLCSYDAADWTDMEKHLAFHLESLALLALPLATGLEGDSDQEEASVQMQQGTEENKGSRDGDFDDTLSATMNEEAIELLDDVQEEHESIDQVTVPDDDSYTPNGNDFDTLWDTIKPEIGEAARAARRAVNIGEQEKQNRNWILVAVDFGTTYSSLAWVLSINPSEIQIVTEWSGANRTFEKVPTALQYEDRSTYRWGFHVDRKKPRYECFKFGLDISRERDQVDTELDRRYPSTTTIPFKNDEHCEQLVIDYLTALREQAESELVRHLGTEVLKYIPRTYIITVPAMFPDKAKRKAISCASRAGMGEENNILIISEPEAAGIYAFDTMDPNDIHVDDTFVVCNMGGGAVELVSYKVIALESTIQVAEAAPGSSRLCGSMYLNRAFADYIKDRFGSNPGWNDNIMSRATEQFDANIKICFDGNLSEDYSILCFGLADDPLSGVENNEFHLSGKEIKDIFEPVITEILKLVVDQILATKKSIKGVILVGGFGNSSYLHKRLQAEFERPIQVYQSRNSWTAALRGALIKGIAYVSQDSTTTKTNIGARVARMHYGIASFVKFDPTTMHDLSTVSVDSINGEYRVSVMEWFINKGTLLRESTVRDIPYRWERSTSAGRPGMITATIFMCEDPMNTGAPYYMTERVEKFAILNADLGSIPEEQLRRKQGADGQMYYSIDYSIEITVHSADITFALVYDGKKYDAVPRLLN